MRAAVYSMYRAPVGLMPTEVAKPAVSDDGVLVRVRASSVNPAEWHLLTGTPYFARLAAGLRGPREHALGTDYAGTVESVGAAVEAFRPGDEVFGGRTGAFAEYVCVPEAKGIVRKPGNISFEEAGAVAIAGVTALQALRDKGKVQPGQKVLINGASGGVGTFAVQIARALGADVTGVCSTRNVELVRSIGADRVIDYSKADFTRASDRYDLMLDIAGRNSWSECRRVLKPMATFVVVGGPKRNRWLGPLSHSLSVFATSRRASQKVVWFFLAAIVKKDLEALAQLLGAGKIKPVIERRYPLSEIGTALDYLGQGHAQGKIVIAV